MKFWADVRIDFGIREGREYVVTQQDGFQRASANSALDVLS